MYSGLFFPLILGVWWKRANKAGAIAGMVGGFASGAIYLYMVQFGGMTPDFLKIWYDWNGKLNIMVVVLIS